MKMEPDGRIDNSALNGIRLLCGKLGADQISKKITSLVGEYGNWGQERLCRRGVMTGFSLRVYVEPFLSPWRFDLRGATDLRLTCSDRGVVEGEGQAHGTWAPPQVCPKKHAICGLQTQVHTEGTNVDDRGLVNARMECCEVPEKGSTCVPTDEWKIIAHCENVGSSPSRCTYAYSQGVTHTVSATNSREWETMTTIGFSASVSIPYIASNFGAKLGFSGTTKTSWSTTTTKTWTASKKITTDIFVRARTYLVLEQVVGECEDFQVGMVKIRVKEIKM